MHRKQTNTQAKKIFYQGKGSMLHFPQLVFGLKEQGFCHKLM